MYIYLPRTRHTLRSRVADPARDWPDIKTLIRIRQCRKKNKPGQTYSWIRILPELHNRYNVFFCTFFVNKYSGILDQHPDTDAQTGSVAGPTDKPDPAKFPRIHNSGERAKNLHTAKIPRSECKLRHHGYYATCIQSYYQTSRLTVAGAYTGEGIESPPPSLSSSHLHVWWVYGRHPYNYNFRKKIYGIK